jgi:hypothetical protein
MTDDLLQHKLRQCLSSYRYSTVDKSFSGSIKLKKKKNNFPSDQECSSDPRMNQMRNESIL